MAKGMVRVGRAEQEVGCQERQDEGQNADAEQSGAGDGRDHFPRAWSTLIGGGKIKSGRLIGATDKDGMKPAKDPVHLRNQVATIYRAAGIEPEEYLTSSVGRPFPLVPDPKPVKDLLG